MSWRTRKPAAGDFHPYYAPYVELVPDGDILEILARQGEETAEFLHSIDDRTSLHRYAADKWSIREIVGHLLDTERVFGYRSLVFARHDAVELPGFDENDYVRKGQFDEIPWEALAESLLTVRQGSLALWTPMTEEASARRGVANGSDVTVRALPYIVAGHERHHMNVIRDRYL